MHHVRLYNTVCSKRIYFFILRPRLTDDTTPLYGYTQIWFDAVYTHVVSTYLHNVTWTRATVTGGRKSRTRAWPLEYFQRPPEKYTHAFIVIFETTEPLLKDLTRSTPPRYLQFSIITIINTRTHKRCVIQYYICNELRLQYLHIYDTLPVYFCNELGRFPDRWTLRIGFVDPLIAWCENVISI